MALSTVTNVGGLVDVSRGDIVRTVGRRTLQKSAPVFAAVGVALGFTPQLLGVGPLGLGLPLVLFGPQLHDQPVPAR